MQFKPIYIDNLAQYKILCNLWFLKETFVSRLKEIFVTTIYILSIQRRMDKDFRIIVGTACLSQYRTTLSYL